jgi:hypothetical protein
LGCSAMPTSIAMIFCSKSPSSQCPGWLPDVPSPSSCYSDVQNGIVDRTLQKLISRAVLSCTKSCPPLSVLHSCSDIQVPAWCLWLLPMAVKPLTGAGPASCGPCSRPQQSSALHMWLTSQTQCTAVMSASPKTKPVSVSLISQAQPHQTLCAG